MRRMKFEMESRIDVVFPSECLQYKEKSKQLKQKYKKNSGTVVAEAKQNREHGKKINIPEVHKEHDF